MGVLPQEILDTDSFFEAYELLQVSAHRRTCCCIAACTAVGEEAFSMRAAQEQYVSFWHTVACVVF